MRNSSCQRKLFCVATLPCVAQNGWLPACLGSPVHGESLDALGLSRTSHQRHWKIYRTACKNTSLRTSPSIMETNEVGLKSSTTETTIFSGFSLLLGCQSRRSGVLEG